MRDKIIHHYFGLDLNLVWEVVEKNIPELQKAVISMLKESDNGFLVLDLTDSYSISYISYQDHRRESIAKTFRAMVNESEFLFFG